ncbi:hypothetical protein ABE354_23865 [Brevibacillus laterosporus]|uniref:hypothetical protein n=1 Tax=Brevibacillus laterosporus TaxID=1465 RepID=UPI003D1D72E3
MDVLKIVESYYDSPEAYYVNNQLVGIVHCDDHHEIKPLLLNIIREHNVKITDFYGLTSEGEVSSR